MNVKGANQPEVFEGTVDAMAQQIKADPVKFWRETTAQDGPILIWEIGGDRFLYNGNHRYHAAVRADEEIPAWVIQVEDHTGSQVPTWPFDQITWLPGCK